jgi:phage FluMu protein Com
MKTFKGKPVREFRCSHCRGLLGDEYIFAGRLFIKCPNCNTLNEIEFKTTLGEMFEYIKRYFKEEKIISVLKNVFGFEVTKGGENK